MKQVFALMGLAVICASCASHSDAPNNDDVRLTKKEASQATASAEKRPKKRVSNKDLPEPSKLVHDPEEVPQAVRAIEGQIDRKAGLLADDVLIEISKNYQFEVSLTGDRVGHALEGVKGTDRIALGPAMAFVRNLKIRADKRIRLRIADFGTKPYIRITAKGHCSHVVADHGRKEVHRADTILIRNDKVRYIEGPPTRVASARR